MSKTSSTTGGRAKRRSTTVGYAVLILSTALVYLLDHPIGSLPALGRLIDPINGCWASAESVKTDFNARLEFPKLKCGATVWFDDQLTPHIYATNDHDLYFLQGYLHAYFRLWQMDMQTRAAAGRVSEAVGDKAFVFDRRQRRKGMLYAAENSLRAAESDPLTRQTLDAYTEGVNSYIAGLKFRSYPLEYKLMGFAPEPWTNLKCVLLLKYMADDLSGKTDDIAHSFLRNLLSRESFENLYPDKIAGSTTVIPPGTAFDPPSLHTPMAPPDSIAFPHFAGRDFDEPRVEGKGSNNWALSGSRTASGAAILCNDPHLSLNLPSLWYKLQLMAPGINVYGASLPGAPGVVIGFNDSLTWGLTNNYRDVKDYYEIKPVKGNRNRYWFAGKELDFIKRPERICIKGKPDFIDTVKYTIHGPVMYDETYYEVGSLKKPLAICWMGHRPSNEILAIYLQNRAVNYNGFVDAILHFECPAQNMLYADRLGNIGLWAQGQFVNKWKDQGRYVMNGWDSATLWKELIPMRENPHVLNPSQGYLCSANQCVTDSTYPYWYNGDFVEFRAWRINEALSNIQKATIQDMFMLQNDDRSILATNALPVMLKYMQPGQSDKYLDALSGWDYRLSSGSIAATVFQVWWSCFYNTLWKAELRRIPFNTTPLQERTMQLLLGDSLTISYNDNSIPGKVYFRKQVVAGYMKAKDSLNKLDSMHQLEWYKAKNTSLTHLTKIPAFSYNHVITGGWGNTVNAMRPNYGPSWRMVVQMGKEIEAYGIYPGGQSGNPGSKYYADYLQQWVEGKYQKLVFLPNKAEQNNTNIKYKWEIKPGT